MGRKESNQIKSQWYRNMTAASVPTLNKLTESIALTILPWFSKVKHLLVSYNVQNPLLILLY